MIKMEMLQALREIAVDVTEKLASERFPTREWMHVSRHTEKTSEYTPRRRPDKHQLEFLLRNLESDAAHLDQLIAVAYTDDLLVRRMLTRPTFEKLTFLNDQWRNDDPEHVRQVIVDRWFVKNIMLDYFLAKKKFIFDAELFDIVAIEKIGQLLTHPSRVKCTTPLYGLQLRSPRIDIEAGICLKTIPLETLEEFINPESPFHRSALNHDVTDFYSVIEEEVSLKKDVEDAFVFPDVFQGTHHQVTAILRFILDQDIMPAFTQYEFIGGYSLWSGTKRIAHERIRPRTDPHIVLTKEKQGEFLAVWRASRSSPNAAHVKLALDRLSMTSERPSDADKLLDYWIGIESILCNDAKDEVTLRAALRMAALLGKSGSEREEIYRHMQHSYSFRSRIVHGSEVKDRKGYSIEMIVKLTRNYLRRAISLILRMKEPFSPNALELALLKRD